MSTLISLVRHEVLSAVQACTAQQNWQVATDTGIEIMRPNRPGLGDFSTNAALVLSAQLRRQGTRLPPRTVATQISACWPAASLLVATDIAGPGFINMTVDPDWFRTQTARILRAPERVGMLAMGQGKSCQVEFISANPTGPLHFGGARNAVLGDTIARILEAAGYSVQREFYVNDAGARFDVFVESLHAAYLQHHGRDAAVPADGYGGAYMQAYAQALTDRIGGQFVETTWAETLPRLRPLALDIVLADVRDEISLIGIHFDRWFSEQAMHDAGEVQAGIDRLAAAGATYERDGAVWFAASRYAGMDQDIVLVRSNGAPTYFAADVAYHRDKLEKRGFDRVVDVWSVDHQGHVPRMQAVIQALGLEPERLHIVLYDLVKLARQGVEITMSKRSGQFLTLREVVSEVSADAVRFMLLTRAPESVLEFDLVEAKAQHQDNPVYFVQYSHARLCSILKRAAEAGLAVVPEEADLEAVVQAQLHHEAEMDLMKVLLSWDEELELAVKRLSPHNLTYYAVRIASTINAFYRDCRVLDAQNPDLTRGRLLLCAASRIVLARVLYLLGVDAPEAM